MSGAQAILIKIADTPDEIEQVHRLNHETFVEEIPQHAGTSGGRLVDAHHERNTYFVAKAGEQVVGMIALTRSKGDRFNVDEKMSDPSRLDPYRGSAAEIRLLAVRKEFRRTLLFMRLMLSFAEYCIAQGFRYAVISGLDKNEALYRRLGFLPVDRPVQRGQACYIPMVLTLDDYLKAAASLAKGQP